MASVASSSNSKTAASKSASSKPSAAFTRLAKATSATPPRQLNQLSAANLNHLTDSVEQALAGHKAAIEQAELNIINQAPRPLRGTVRRVLGSNQ